MYSKKNSAPSLDLARFAGIFTEQTETHRWRATKLAYSGGVDSQVLLHILADLRSELSLDIQALHIHHGMHPQADEWEQFCRSQCDQLGIDFVSSRVKVDAAATGPEAAARAARYRALAQFVKEGEVLLTAHHEDDQAETFLLQLMRGAGAAGLASMPLVNQFATGHHFRPLLSFSRRQILSYARDKGLTWVDDPSNFDPGVRRSFLRQQLLPMLQQHWPQATAMISRSAAHIAEADSLLAELAKMDQASSFGEKPGEMSVRRLSTLPAPRLRNVLRFWIREQGWTAPSAQQLLQITTQIYEPSTTAQAVIRWGSLACYRYRDRLWVQPWEPTTSLTDFSCEWSPGSGPLQVPAAGIELVAKAVTGQGLARERTGDTVTVRFRSGGEGCRLGRQGHRTSLKNLFQEAGIPSWDRDRTPLVYVGGELVAVGDRWVCEPFTAQENEAGWKLKIAQIQQK